MSEMIKVDTVDYRAGETVAILRGRDDELVPVTFVADWRPALTIADALKEIGTEISCEVEEYQIVSRGDEPEIRAGDPCPSCNGEGRVDHGGIDVRCADCWGGGTVLPLKRPADSAPGIDETPPF